MMPALEYTTAFVPDAHAPAEPATRPGLTSLIRTSRGLMTIQTELVGDPVTISTIVDFRGRVLKRWTHPLTFASGDARLIEVVREWHVEHERRVRESLSKVTRARRTLPTIGQAVSRMYLAGMAAYAKRDFEAAEVAWRACARMLPEDRRVQAALTRIAS